MGGEKNWEVLISPSPLTLPNNTIPLFIFIWKAEKTDISKKVHLNVFFSFISPKSTGPYIFSVTYTLPFSNQNFLPCMKFGKYVFSTHLKCSGSQIKVILLLLLSLLQGISGDVWRWFLLSHGGVVGGGRGWWWWCVCFTKIQWETQLPTIMNSLA